MSARADEIMSKPVVFVSPETSVAEIASILATQGVSAVPVCGPDGTLEGLVSEAEILEPLRESKRLRRDWWLGMVAEGEELSQEFLDYLRRDLRRARDVMVRHVVTASEDATIPELAELMMRHRIKRLPIMRGERVVGIVSRSDMIGAVAKAPAMLV